MTPEQLVKGNELNEKLRKISRAKERVGTLRMAWRANDCTYGFQGQLEVKELDTIFNEVTETARILLIQKIEQYKVKIENELKDL